MSTRLPQESRVHLPLADLLCQWFSPFTLQWPVIKCGKRFCKFSTLFLGSAGGPASQRPHSAPMHSAATLPHLGSAELWATRSPGGQRCYHYPPSSVQSPSTEGGIFVSNVSSSNWCTRGLSPGKANICTQSHFLYM